MYQLSRLLTGSTLLLSALGAGKKNACAHTVIQVRGHKNFGHGREPIPIISLLWHTFLTVSFISCGLEFKQIKNFFFPSEKLADVEGDPLASTKTDVIRSSPM